MAEFKDERVYDSRKLTQWFLGAGLALLLSVGWMAWADYHRAWKEYQRRFMRLETAHTREKLGEVKSGIDMAQYNQLKSELHEAQQELLGHRERIGALESKEAKLDAKIYKVNSDYQLVKANIDADKYAYSESVKKERGDASLKKKLDGEIDEANALSQELFEMGRDRDQAAKDLADLAARRDAADDKIKKMTADFTALKKRIQGLSFNALFYFRNAMFLDFMSPTLQIRQVVLKNIPEDLYFSKTMRVDRCMSCHLAIDKKGYEDAPQPFRTHPRLDLYMGASSPHPMEKVGCTICHGGMGQALDFNTCAHVPNDGEQAKKWSAKYSWTHPEGVQSMMLPLKYTEGSCLKCHGLQEHVNFAPRLDRGRELMVTRGCVGCHKVKNLEGLTKAGPSLLKVKGKLSKDFVRKWVWSPRSFNPAARMPSFFQQSNNDDADTLAKNKAELNALVDCLYERSGDYQPNQSPGYGRVDAGKKLFKEVGCLACHGIDDVASHHADFAPDLSGIGSKLSASFVYTWIKNPRHFNPETRMPSLRLSDQEASDITAYLMSKRNKDFEQAASPEGDAAVRDGLILDYLKPKMGEDGAKTQLAGMDEKLRTLFLGEKTLNKYGCFGCHMIQGFEKAQGIGTDLSTWGTKQIGQIDFGFTEEGDIPHTREGFLNAKLGNPRVFDKAKVVPFQEKLKMPNFYLSEEEREAVVTAVLGLTNTPVPDEMTAGIHGNGPLLEKGRRVIADYNCRGCHLIEDQGGRIRELYDKENIDLSLAPPNLRKEGAKVQIGWFHDFLTNVHPIRPWLKIRMPSFHWTDEQLSDVITYFNLKEDQTYPFKTVETKSLGGADLGQAKVLFAKLQCAKCHIVGSKIPADLGSAAPDLLKVHSRLKPEWVAEWLKNPEDLMPGTRMPGFWPQDASPAPEFFHGNSLAQREALRDYLFMLGKN